jgi:hypothetical protein
MSGDFQKVERGFQGDLLSLGALAVSRAEGSQDTDALSPNSPAPDVPVGSATIHQNREALRVGSALVNHPCQGNRLVATLQMDSPMNSMRVITGSHCIQYSGHAGHGLRETPRR